MKEIIENDKCRIYIDLERKEISGTDKEDQYNLPAFFTQSKRGLKKAAETLKAKIHPQMTMNQAIQVLRDCKIKCHYYCRMD
jgi:hypothetical protein